MTMRSGNLVAGSLFLCLTATGAGMAANYFPQAAHAMETPTVATLAKGVWPVKFESAFGKSLPIATHSRKFWGSAEYRAFGDGRKDVVPGTGGWLFTAEEFACPAGAEQNLAENISYIRTVRGQLAARNTALAVVVVPAKARVYDDALKDVKLTSCRMPLYDRAMAFLQNERIPAPKLLAAMQAAPAREKLFLKADTHWSPEGARLAAQATAGAIGEAGIKLDYAAFTSQGGTRKAHAGDLARYLPGVEISEEELITYSSGTAVASTAGVQDLFDETAPTVALVGTSYSANPDWHFDGFLKEKMSTDIVNMGDEGQGPFAVMDTFLANKPLQDAPLKLVVWEIPERYLVYPHGVAPK